MIRFTCVIDKTIQFAVTGHATAAGVPGGFNAVCGMVSVLAQAALWGCANYGEDTEVISAAPGALIFVCKRDAVTEAVVCSAAEGIRQVAKQFPECFEKEHD